MLIARAASTARMISDRPAWIIISSLARPESGAVSVGLNAVLAVNTPCSECYNVPCSTRYTTTQLGYIMRGVV